MMRRYLRLGVIALFAAGLSQNYSHAAYLTTQDPRIPQYKVGDPKFGTALLYGDGQSFVCNVSTTAGSKTLTVSGTGCTFAAGDVGKMLRITGAGGALSLGYLATIPVATSGAGYAAPPTVSISGGNGDAQARAVMSIGTTTPAIASGGSGCLAGGSGSMMFAVAQGFPNGGYGRPVVVTATITNGVATAITAVLDAGYYVAPSRSTWAALPNITGATTTPVGAVAKATIVSDAAGDNGTVSAAVLTNITATAYSATEISNGVFYPSTFTGALPNFKGTFDSNNKLNGTSVLSGGQGFNPLTPLGITVPAPASQNCTTNPTLNLNFGVAAVQVIDPGTGFSLSTAATATFSGGNPTTAATFGTLTTTTIWPGWSSLYPATYANGFAVLRTTIASGSGTTIQMADAAGTTLNAQAEIVFWGHSDQPALQAACSGQYKAILPAGKYWIDQAIIPSTNCSIVGFGREFTSILNMPGADDDMVRSPNFNATFPQVNSNTQGQGFTTTDNVELAYIRWDGNYIAQDVFNPERQRGLAIYGFGINIHDGDWHGMIGECWVTDGPYNYGPGGASFTTNFNLPGTFGCGRAGWLDHGPHDQDANTNTMVDTGQEGDDIYPAFQYYGSVTGEHEGDHPYHSGPAVNRASYSVADYNGMTIIKGSYEGARSNIYTAGGTVFVTGSRAYSNFGGPGAAEMIIAGNGVSATGFRFDGANYVPRYAIQFGVPYVGSAAYNQFTQTIINQLGGMTSPFNFAADGGNNVLSGTGQSGGAPIAASNSPVATDCFTYTQTGISYTLQTCLLTANQLPAISGGDVTAPAGSAVHTVNTVKGKVVLPIDGSTPMSGDFVANNGVVIGTAKPSSSTGLPGNGGAGLYVQWGTSLSPFGGATILNQKGGGTGGIQFGEVDLSGNVSKSILLTPTQTTVYGALSVGSYAYFPKLAAATVAPGAGIANLYFTTGTNSGTCKLVALAGTSKTAVTIADNIGAGC